MSETKRILRFLAALRGAHPDTVALFTEGACYELWKIMRVIWPEAVPMYSQQEGHVYIEIDGRLYDIRGLHLRAPADLRPLDHNNVDRPHRWARRDTRRLIVDVNTEIV